MRTLAVSLALLVYASVAQAENVCIEPDSTPPTCTERTPEKRFETTEEFEACRDAVDAYTQALGVWVTCIADDAKNRARRDYKNFACKTRADTFCH